MTVQKPIEKQNKLKGILLDLTTKAGISERALARLLKIPPTTLYKLLSTDDPNPSVKTLLPIARHFKISIEQLMGEEPINKLDHNPLESTPWQPVLFVKAVNAVSKILAEQKRTIDSKAALNLIKEIYFYSLNNHLQEIDSNFAKWLINKSIFDSTS
jgi:transcriptional regulator with XRE-family HTH domain